MIGEILNGYVIKEFIDSGSFGSVYKAEKNGLFFAIKAFNADYVFKEYREHGSNNRIDREIAIMKSLNHMNLVRYEEDFYLEYKNVKYYFLVMEYIDGITLQKYIDSNGKLEKDEIIPIFRQILEGVRALHNIHGNDDTKGIIHRDLKPQNIMITHDGIVKVLDYGISKVIDFTTITSTGDFLGSPIYSSPEQIVNSKNIDKRSDLYTLGVILYYAITKEIPYHFSNQGELINQIVKESPIPPRQKDFKIDNKIENIILKLLEKEPYRRYENIDRLIELVENIDQEQLETKAYDLSKRFYSLLYNDKTVLEKYIQQFPNKKTSVIFPANHQFQQKNLLKLCQSEDFSMIVDPATIRLTYSSYADVQGLKNLPYSPQGLQPISPTSLGTLEKQQTYTKSVLDEELRLNANILISPFHYPHNSSTISTFDRNTIKEWFDLDIKLLKESINYRDEFFPEKQLYAGVCLNGESLNDERYRNDIMNIFSSFDCDGYLIYVDGIDKDSSAPTIYNYIKTLRDLQHYTQKPVIASRIDVLGLGLLCVGIAGFASGIARFESFYEGLYTDEGDAYNMYERYYFPQLLGTVPIKRDTPTTFEPIVQKLGACMCSFCSGKTPLETIKSPVNKLHYLELIDGEISKINNLGESIRIEYFLGRIQEAINNYKMLSRDGLFREKNYKHLEVWKTVFNQLLQDQNV